MLADAETRAGQSGEGDDQDPTSEQPNARQIEGLHRSTTERDHAHAHAPWPDIGFAMNDNAAVSS
jgi:hypothetical protein